MQPCGLLGMDVCSPVVCKAWMHVALWFARHECVQPCGLLGMDACGPVVC